MGAINCRGFEDLMMCIMKSLLVLCLLVLLTIVHAHGGSRWGARRRSYRRQEYRQPSHHDYNYRPPTRPPPSALDLYNQLPDDILGSALCVILGSDYYLRLYAYRQIERTYGWRARYIFAIMSRMTNFRESLGDLRDEELRGMSSAGKDRLCNLLQNMPARYKECGFGQLIDVLSDDCTPAETTAAATAVTTTIPSTTPTTTTSTTTSPTTTTSTTTTSTTTAATTTTTTAAPAFNCKDLSTIRALATTTRIVGGIAAQQGAYDSYASLNIGGSVNPVCGATIIDSCTILTASHCVDGRTADEIQVNVGDHTTIGSTTQLTVNSIQMHENYNTQTTANDVAILKVDPIDFNAIPNTAPACRATADYALGGQDCIAVGVGTTSFGGRQPDDYALQEVSLPTFDGNTCDTNSSILIQMTDPSNQICAGEAGKDSCQGDSGGPLYCQQDGQQVLTGVVSYGVNCALGGYPGVYAKVSSYDDWIDARSGC
ncbi:proclotting enzyme-like [Haliotis asinina]|uniref:proclotting enzyme-like n=1 Tax=Haliotis asinina TaxID=109174 RepID=UPI0035324FC2